MYSSALIKTHNCAVSYYLAERPTNYVSWPFAVRVLSTVIHSMTQFIILSSGLNLAAKSYLFHLVCAHLVVCVNVLPCWYVCHLPLLYSSNYGMLKENCQPKSEIVLEPHRWLIQNRRHSVLQNCQSSWQGGDNELSSKAMGSVALFIIESKNKDVGLAWKVGGYIRMANSLGMLYLHYICKKKVVGTS